MGSVYVARDDHTGREVAVKCLLDASQSARFEIEARLLAQMDHPNVVSVLDHFREGDDYFLVMDLVRGEDLAQVLRAEGHPGLPLNDVLDYVEQLLAALQHVHAHGIIHRDVKLENVIRGERIVLVDFGIARELPTTGVGTVAIGTPRFMAPEVFAGGAASERSDVYSLGVTVWVLLTGEPPGYAPAPGSLLQRCPEATPDLERVLLRAVEVRPEDRFTSVAAFAAAVGRPLARTTAHHVGDSPPAEREVLESVLRTAADLFDAASAAIAVPDASGERLLIQVAWGECAREVAGKATPEDGIAMGAFIRGEPIVVESAGAAAVQMHALPGTSYVPHTLMAAPVTRNGVVRGVLVLTDRRDGRAYTAADANRAQRFAELVAHLLGQRAEAPGA